MKTYIDYIKDFFEPKFVTYELKLPIKEVLQKFDEILNAEKTLNNPKALKGSITGNKFLMSLIAIDIEEANFSAALKGTMYESSSRKTNIEVYILRDSATYMTFFLLIIASVIYFVMYYLDPANTKALFWGFAILILGTYFSIWFSNSSIKTLQGKFETFLIDVGGSFLKTAANN